MEKNGNGDNPFEYNPFIARGVGAASAAEDGGGDADEDRHADDDAPMQDTVVTPGTGMDGDDTVMSIIVPDGRGMDGADFTEILHNDEDDDGYDVSDGSGRRWRIIIVATVIIAVLALIIALAWALGADPLHIGEMAGGPPPQGSSQGFRGSGCRIDGQSCSSDDNGNHPEG